MAKGTFYIPSGTKNLKPLFPSIDWRDIKDYFVQVLDSTGAIVASTNIIKVCECNNDESVRIHFLNYCGHLDAVNLQKPKITHDTSSSEYQKGAKYPLSKTDSTVERFNIRSNDIYTCKLKCLETEMAWLQELADTPVAFIEWSATEGQPDDYLPVVVLNGKFEKLKNEREFDYEFVIEFKLGNEFLNLRNW